MSTLELRKSVLNYVDSADDRLLKLIKALVETYQEDENNYEISEEHQKVLDRRLEDHKAGPDAGKDWKVLKPELRKKYGA